MQRRSTNTNSKNIEYEFFDETGKFYQSFGSNNIFIRRYIDTSTFSYEYKYCCGARIFRIDIINKEKIKVILSTKTLPYYVEYIDTNKHDNPIGFMDGNSGREAGEYGFFHRNLLKLRMEIFFIEDMFIINIDLLASEVDKKSYWDPIKDPEVQKCFDSHLSEKFTMKIPKEKITEFLAVS